MAMQLVLVYLWILQCLPGSYRNHLSYWLQFELELVMRLASFGYLLNFILSLWEFFFLDISSGLSL